MTGRRVILFRWQQEIAYLLLAPLKDHSCTQSGTQIFSPRMGWLTTLVYRSHNGSIRQTDSQLGKTQTKNSLYRNPNCAHQLQYYCKKYTYVLRCSWAPSWIAGMDHHGLWQWVIMDCGNRSSWTARKVPEKKKKKKTVHQTQALSSRRSQA